MTGKVCVVTGVGPGTGAGMARRFAEGGYKVAMIARNEDRLNEIATESDNLFAYPGSVREEDEVNELIARISKELGPVDVLLHNAVRGTRGTFLEIDPIDLEKNFKVNVMGYLYLARAVAPHMIEQGWGAIIATGNTAATRGKDFFAGFAGTKAAQRILGESMARDLGPKGVHVAYIMIDAAIDVPWTREAFADKPDEFFTKPSAIADTVWHLAHQDKSAWTYDITVRPFGEHW